MIQTITYYGGYALAYAEFGDPEGYPVLVQHGLIASIDDYTLFGRLLRLKTRLVCVARPGYGESSPYSLASYAEWGDLVSVLVSHLELGQFDLLGMSSGAPYAYAIACRLAGRVRNVFIFSGMPALYDPVVRSLWPYPLAENASIAEMQVLARSLFFSNVSQEDLERSDIRDSMRNECFGVALDLLLRAREWGFNLSEVKARVVMRHSRTDEAVPFPAAARTADLLPHCRLIPVENAPHFSPEALDDFLATEMSPYYERRCD